MRTRQAGQVVLAPAVVVHWFGQGEGDLTSAQGPTKVFEKRLAQGFEEEFGRSCREGGEEGFEFGCDDVWKGRGVFVLVVGAERVERGEEGHQGGSGSVVGDLGGGEGGGWGEKIGRSRNGF